MADPNDSRGPRPGTRSSFKDVANARSLMGAPLRSSFNFRKSSSASSGAVIMPLMLLVACLAFPKLEGGGQITCEREKCPG